MSLTDPLLANPRQQRFFPYAFNGGTVLAIAGENFAVIASDNRLSEGFRIHSRDIPKLYAITGDTVLGCCGFHGDCLTVTKELAGRVQVSTLHSCSLFIL
jgi:20S proteasome subunit beta 6